MEEDGDGTFSSPERSWRSVIQPYIRNVQILQCPSYRPPGALFDGSDWTAGGQVRTSGYGMNLTHYWHGHSPIWCDEARVTHPSIFITFGDLENYEDATLGIVTGYSITFRCKYGDSWGSPFPHGLNRTMADHGSGGATRHNGGANYVFYDGHAKSFPPTAIPCEDGNCYWMPDQGADLATG
jgi:prepilin-type processing-associated H-X9-DG protein